LFWEFWNFEILCLEPRAWVPLHRCLCFGWSLVRCWVLSLQDGSTFSKAKLPPRPVCVCVSVCICMCLCVCARVKSCAAGETALLNDVYKKKNLSVIFLCLLLFCQHSAVETPYVGMGWRAFRYMYRYMYQCISVLVSDVIKANTLCRISLCWYEMEGIWY
jgi:hypothetical protein